MTENSLNTAVSHPAAGYAEALDWLFVRTRAGRERSVTRMARLIGQLQLTVPPKVAHVVGTNGKGTVSAMLAAGLQAQGETTGLFISPHVTDYRERISVNGRQIPEREVTQFVTELHGTVAAEAAFFELTLALALRHFAERQVSFLVLEAGVGARNDATSAVGNTVLTVVTSIAADHQETLGTTIAEITADKAAAIRPGQPLVTANQGEALRVLRRTALEQGSPLYHPADDPRLFSVPAGLRAQGTRAENQRLAAAALRLLGASEEAVAAGVSRPALPGRGERFRIRGRTVLLDGAHDPAAARALVAGLEPGYVLLYAGLGRKQRLLTCRQLASGAASVISTDVAGHEPLDWPGAQVIKGSHAAFTAALALTPPAGLLVIAGSLYLAGELRPLLSELSET